MEETTTDAATQDEALQAQPPVDEQPAEAVTTADSEPQQTTDTETESDEATADTETPSDDEDISEWASKKGIDLSTPEGQQKALKSMREAEKAFHTKAQQASELEKQVQGQTAETSDERLARMEMILNAKTFKEQRGITPEQDEAMGTYLTQNPDKLQLVKYGFMTFDDVFALSGAGSVDADSLKKQGRDEALQDLSTRQRASSVKGSASAQSAPPAKDPLTVLWETDD